MRTNLAIGLLLGLVACGCDSDRRVVDPDDLTPPGEPHDVWSVTGDGEVTLYWSAPPDYDVAGFSVFISQDDRDYYRLFTLDNDWHHAVIGGEDLPASVPFVFVNGNTYFLGVSAFDDVGNESELTETSTTFDTPRPSGSVRLYRADGARADESGYDFSRSPYGYAMSATSLFTDVYFTFAAGVPVLRTPHPQVVELMDMGWLDFDDPRVGWFSEAEWFPVAEVPLQLGHVILVRIWEETRAGNTEEPFNVAKLGVVSVDGESVLLDWAYQIDPNNYELKPQLPPPSVPSVPAPPAVAAAAVTTAGGR